LLELLISMTLLLMIVVILGGAFRLSFRSLGAGEKRIEALERFRTSLGIITAQLQSSIPLTYNEDGTKKSYFKGTAETLRFASGYSIWGENQGTVIVSYRREPGDGGRWALYAAEKGVSIEDIQEVKLLDNLKGVSFSYFGKEVAEEDGRWRTEWTNDTTAPEQVQITYQRDQKEEKVLVPLFARIVIQPI
jgi:general secretion pathway protein J